MFESIMGQSYPKRYLKNSIEKGRIGNAYIFDGLKGVGKFSMAVEFAEILTERRIDATEDIIIIQPQGATSAIKIDEIRALNSTVNIMPESKYKVIIIDDADKMTVQAQNALLKTMEEPPSYICLILVTSNREGLLATIRSRGEMVKFSPVGESDIVDMLIKRGADAGEAKIIAGFSKGSVSSALGLIESDEISDLRKYIISLSETLIKEQKGEILKKIEDMKGFKERIDEALDMLANIFLDAYLLKRRINRGLIVNIDKISLLRNINGKISYSQISRIIDIIYYARKKLKSNCNFSITMQVMVLNIYEVIN